MSEHSDTHSRALPPVRIPQEVPTSAESRPSVAGTVSFVGRVLTLQRSIGNRLVTALLTDVPRSAADSAGAEPEPRGAPVLQRKITVKYTDLLIPLGERSKNGAKIFGNLQTEVQGYHSDVTLGLKGDALKRRLEKLVELGERYLKANQGVMTKEIELVNRLVNEAKTDLGVAPTVVPVATSAPPVVAGPPPLLLRERLVWMKKKRQEATATPQMVEANSKINKAIKQLDLIQSIQMERVQHGEDANLDAFQYPSGDAEALSELLKELFTTFSLTAHGFSATDPTGHGSAPPTMAAFGAKVKEELRGLQIGKASDFADAEVVLSGSAVTGVALLAKGGAKAPKPFGAHSDFDVGVVSARLLSAVRDAGGEVRGGTRTAPDPVTPIAELSARLSAFAKREVSIMVYKNRDAAQRAPGIRLS